MAAEERLSGALQENVLVLLCFNDVAAGIIRNTIQPGVFESSIFRDIASHAITFYDEYKEPVKEHLPDVLESVLQGKDTKKAAAYTRVLDNLYQSRDSVHVDYVINSLHAFIRQQQLKAGVVEAVALLQEGNVDAAEVGLEKMLRMRSSTFDVGTVFSDTNRSLSFFDAQDHAYHMGIKELDDRDIGPRPGEMFLFIAPPKRGKSWWLMHVGKYGLLQRKRVLHITLEMSEERVSQRYVQTFFSIAKREASLVVPHLRVDELGRLIDIGELDITRPTFKDHDIRKFVENNIKRRFTTRPPLVIKGFPSGSLTLNALRAYLDNLERHQKFIPDIVCLDYPDLMNKDIRALRESVGQTFVDLRGLAQERGFALACPTQGNRESSKAKLVTDDMVSEDWSKIMTADNVLTYNQTDAERKLGLARIFVSNGRNDEDKFSVLISQSYAIGQFCLDSAMMLSDYDKIVDRASGTDTDDDD